MAEVFRNFLAGRQLAQQEQQYGNQLAQQQFDNERQNRLMGMQEQQFQTQQDRQVRQDEVADRTRQREVFATQLAPFAQRALQSGRPQAFVGAALRDPAFHPIFREAGFDPSAIDVNSPDFMQSLETIAAFGGTQDAALRDNIGNANPGDFTPQSYQAWLRSGNSPATRDYSVLQRTWAPPAISVRDVGGAPTIVDPGNRLGGGQTTQLITPEQQRAADAAAAGAKTTATETAQADVAAQSALPKVEGQADSMIGSIDQLLASPGLPYITGLYSKAPIVPNTPQAAADALAKQLEGQSFLQAFESLKGAGQITEIEGQKATAAMGRLQRAQSLRDYRIALQELRGIVDSARNRARSRAQRGAPAPGAGSAPAANAQSAGQLVDWSAL